MSNRFEAIGSFVYEKGNRIGVTLDEASVELARKLNAYQMRVERLKAEVERLNDAIMRGASIPDAKPTE
jgi:cell division protein FtsB